MLPDSLPAQRRGFLRRLAGFAGLSAASRLPVNAQAIAVPPEGSASSLPAFARRMHHISLKQSSYDRTGGNADSVPIGPGATRVVFESEGPGSISHIWFAFAARSPDQLKDMVLRAYWDGNPKPSVETPIGDFFGLNLNTFFVYQSAFLNCSPVRALNSYFPMPFRRSARLTITNDAKVPVDAFYYNIDYELSSSLPADAMYFHAQYRQKTPNQAVQFATGQPRLNLSGRQNYVFAEIHGTGHLMGVTLGVLQNTEYWMGEGDEMIFIDDQENPRITGTGTEDYFNGAWDFGGRDGSIPFGYLYNGASYITTPEHTGGRYCLYRWHAENPVTFNRYLKHTIEHGDSNDRADNYFSVCYWYQTEPYTDFPPLPALADRIPQLTRL
jgi:hypothetical protein